MIRTMKHPNRRCFAAACAAVMLLLTGCGNKRETDLSARYPDYFKYSFGDSCRFSYVRTRKTGDVPNDLYQMEYYRADGKLRTVGEDMLVFQTWKDSGYENTCPEDTFYLSELELLVDAEITSIFKTELCLKIFQKYFPFAKLEENNNNISLGNDGSIMATAATVCSVMSSDPDEAEIARSMYDPENGVCVCKYDLSSVVQDGRYFCMVYMMLKESADTEKYNQPFQDAMAELKALGVQNLSAFIRQEQSEAAARRQVYRVDYMLGTTVPVGELQKDDNYSVLGDMRERVIAKYKSKKQ